MTSVSVTAVPSSFTSPDEGQPLDLDHTEDVHRVVRAASIIITLP